ncbi:MAG TPA: porin family protein [Hyphomicrobiaceae bacterium]|nr:porin family protein [Hyphomicrobiaceae bacterium]
MSKYVFTGLVASVAAMATVSQALAADLGPYRPPAPPETYVERPSMFSWRGFYAGLNGGYAWGSGDSTFVNNGTVAGDLSSVDPDGWFGGGQLGYNAQFGNFVLGVEGDFQGTGVDGSKLDNIGPVAFRTSNDMNWFSTLRARAGFAADRVLIYATGGVAWADVDFSLYDFSTATRFSGGDTLTGYTIGGGVEWALANNWTFKGEYLYIDLDDAKFHGGGTSANFDNAFHTVRFGLNYKF